MTLDRRAFLAGMVGALVPCSAGAQPQRGLPAHRIGWISTEAQPDPFVDGFREGLRRHGYVEGQSVILDLRYTRDLEALRTAVTELTQSKVAFIVSSGPATRSGERGTFPFCSRSAAILSNSAWPQASVVRAGTSRV